MAAVDRFGERVGCGYCAHESTCEKRVQAMDDVRSGRTRMHFPTGGYTKYLARYCRGFELAKGVIK